MNVIVFPSVIFDHRQSQIPIFRISSDEFIVYGVDLIVV